MTHRFPSVLAMGLYIIDPLSSTFEILCDISLPTIKCLHSVYIEIKYISKTIEYNNLIL